MIRKTWINKSSRSFGRLSRSVSWRRSIWFSTRFGIAQEASRLFVLSNYKMNQT